MKTFNTFYTDSNSLYEMKEHIDINKLDKTLIQVFTSKCDKDYITTLIQDINNTFPNAMIIGATTAGEIINSSASEHSTVISFTIFEHTTVRSLKLENMDNNYFELGRNAAKEILTPNTKVLILFSSGITSNSENTLRGIEEVNKNVVVAGGKAADNGKLEKSYVFTEKGIVESGLVCAALDSERLSVYTDQSFCWEPIGKIMTVTDVSSGVIKEIDNQNVLDVFAKYLGYDVAESLPGSAVEFPFIIRRGDMKIARVAMGKYDNKSLVFDGNINVGDKVQFGYGNVDMIVQKSLNIINGLKKLPIETLFIYSCMARKVFLQEMVEMELASLKEISPSAGFFTYGEFYHTGERNEFLNETMTILGLSEDGKCDKLCNIHKHINTQPAEVSFQKEYGSVNSLKVLTHLVNTVTTELDEINHSLEEKNNELQKALDQLRETQSFLIYSEKMASIGNLVSGVANELNTPLAAIKSNLDTEALLLGKVNCESIEGLTSYCKNLHVMNEISKKALEKVLEITSGLKNFSSLDGADIRQVDLHNELDNAIILLGNKLRGRISISRSYGELPLITCYAQQLNQALLNVLLNSVKSIESNGEIRISTNYIEDKIRIVIEDNGKGIPEDYLPKIFSSDFSSKEVEAGCGLGLSITYKIIEKHKGRIFVESIRGVGTRFSIELPVSVLYT